MIYSWFLRHRVIDGIRDKNLKVLFSLFEESVSLLDSVATCHPSPWAEMSTYQGTLRLTHHMKPCGFKKLMPIYCVGGVMLLESLDL